MTNSNEMAQCLEQVGALIDLGANRIVLAGAGLGFEYQLKDDKQGEGIDFNKVVNDEQVRKSLLREYREFDKEKNTVCDLLLTMGFNEEDLKSKNSRPVNEIIQKVWNMFNAESQKKVSHSEKDI